MFKINGPVARSYVSNAFWFLPYEIRRALFRIVRPSEYADIQSLRSVEHGRSLKHFVDNQCIFVRGALLCREIGRELPIVIKIVDIHRSFSSVRAREAG